MKIGKISIKTPIFLAPMSGVTDYTFRILCKQMGASVVYSEFVSAHGIIRENEKTLDMIRFTEAERPIGIQIFGDSPDVMAKAAQMVAHKFQPDIVDINYGCPVPKITKKGAGSAALKNLNLMEEITSAVVESIPELPVTVKMRAGWNSDNIVTLSAGTLLEKCGIKAITLHPRTTNQRYAGKSNWSMIRELKKAVSIPVIGNGDINTPDDGLRMFDETGCDAIMIGRATLGNPWIFEQLNARLNGMPPPPNPEIQDKLNMCKLHLELLIESRGEKIATNLMRKHFGWYVKGFPGAAALRKSLVTATNINEMRLLI